MAGFFNALSASLVLLMLMSVGYFMGHMGWMGPQEKKFLSKFMMNIAVPCNCIAGILNNLDKSDLAEAGVMLLSGICGVVVTLLGAVLLALLLKLPRQRWGVFVAMAGMSNTLFIGIPVCTQLFGEVSMPYIMVYYLGHTAFLQSFGVMLVERSGTVIGEKTTFSGFLKTIFTKPPILGVIAAIILLVTGLTPPAPVMKFAGYISGTVAPLGLIYCGFIIYEVGLKNVRFMRGLPTMLVYRLAVAPVICMFFCNLFGMTGLARDVFVVESALPVVTQVTVMAGAYGADEKYAATGACLSTLGSFITIPILMTILG